EHLNAELDAAVADPAVQVVVAFLDLDRFKHINDAYGHATGDLVLVDLGDRLRTTMPDSFVSRFGGDEYVIVATGSFDNATAALLAQEVAETMKTPIEVNGADLHLTGSVGIAMAHPGDTAEDLIRNADTAMYRSKEQGTNGFAVFDQPMRQWVMHRAGTERDLHRALEQGELFLHYQPKVPLAGRGPVGFEALARWNHPTRGLVPPGEFIPIAEDTGLITAIGTWALEEASRQAAAWRVLNNGFAVPVAVNLAARQLADPMLPDLIARTLETVGAVPGDLVLEITESAVLGDTDAVSKRLRRLRDAGVRISIDDFGTGYSSLSYLQQLPIDELKIDRAFVSKLPFEESSTAIIGSVIDLAHAIGLSVVAEGVETGEQLETLRGLGCDVAQGFYLARPEPEPEATARLLGIIDAVRRSRHEPALRV
ncbi:MAG: putative bifunctional diguanylate cyclase/phosphodiesterase, partial [Acidimicrobiales bacterium]